MPRLAAGAATLLLIPAFGAPGLAWEREVVDSGAVGSYSSIEVGPLDRIHISYFAGGAGHLKYAFHDGTGWAVETVDSNFLTGHHTSLALDSAGEPRIAYRYYTGRSIRYASPAGPGWTFSDFETDPDMETDISMALDAADLPHVSYYDGYFFGEPHDLKHARFDGTGWVTVLVDAPGQVGRGSSIALDSAGRPHISYYDESSVTLEHAHFDGVAWTVTPVDDVEFIAFNFRTAIAVDSADRVHIAYSAYHYDGTDWAGRLKYAKLDAGGWTVSVIDESLPTRDFRIPAIAIDTGDRPHVSYLIYYNQEPITADLKYARFDGTGWQIEFVDTGDIADSDFSNSIALDSAGRPHLSYAESGALIHAFGTGPAAAEGGVRERTGGLALDPPHPNPGRGVAAITFRLARAADIDLALFGVGGRRLATLARGWHEAGEHTTGTAAAAALPAGAYFVRLRAGNAVAARKLVVGPGRPGRPGISAE